MVLHLALCCVTGLLQMNRRSSKGKNIVTSDQSTPIAKWTRLSSQSSKDSNCERFRTPLNSHIYSSIFDLASPTVERVVEFNTLKTTLSLGSLKQEIGQPYSGILKNQWMNWSKNATPILVTLELN